VKNSETGIMCWYKISVIYFYETDLRLHSILDVVVFTYDVHYACYITDDYWLRNRWVT